MSDVRRLPGTGIALGDQPSASDRSLRSYAQLVPLLGDLIAHPPGDQARGAARADLAAGFLPLVRNIARRYVQRGEPLEDLEQVGSVGLLVVLDRFDPAPDSDVLAAFLGYAVPSVAGEIRRHFRDRTWAVRVPRRLKDLQIPLREATAELSQSLNRAPRPTEIAARLGCSVDDVIEALRAQDAYRATSFDSGTHPVGATLGWIDDTFDRVEHRQALHEAFGRLPAREQRILRMRFFDDLTQTQIAAQVGLSQMQVSRILRQTLDQVRRQIAVT